MSQAAEHLKIYIPDPTYGNSDLDDGSAVKFQEELSAKLQKLENDIPEIKIKPILQANIGVGADWPAFLMEVVQDGRLQLLALFFSGKLINENLDGWISIGKKLRSLLKNTKAYFNRSGAFLNGLAKLSDNTNAPNTIRLLQYSSKDGRFVEDWQNEDFTENEEIAPEVSQEWIGGRIHYFRILADNEEFEIRVYSQEVEIKKKS